MLPSLGSLSLLPIGCKRISESEANASIEGKRQRQEDACPEEFAYRGANGRYALEKCIAGGHFSWDFETAKDYAVPEFYTELGYVIEVSPLWLYLTGADMQHGGQWWNFYDSFDVEDQSEPSYWLEMTKLVGAWRDAIAANELRGDDTSSRRTEESYIQTLRWQRPTAAIASLLETAGAEPPPDWDSDETRLVDWKLMVHAAIRAAPWNHPGPGTNEFVATGGNVTACINKVTEYYTDANYDRTVEVVYERGLDTPLGSLEAAEAFAKWYREST